MHTGTASLLSHSHLFQPLYPGIPVISVCVERPELYRNVFLFTSWQLSPGPVVAEAQEAHLNSAAQLLQEMNLLVAVLSASDLAGSTLPLSF